MTMERAAQAERVPRKVTLSDVYSEPHAAHTLYDLMKEREPHVNISHQALPSFETHLKFLATRPYAAWYLIVDEMDPATTPPVNVGAIYLSKQREVGLFVFKDHQGKGYGTAALAKLIAQHPGKILANIAPGNKASQAFFKNAGFRHIQETYVLS